MVQVRTLIQVAGPSMVGLKKKVGLAFGLGYLGRGAWETAKEWET